LTRVARNTVDLTLRLSSCRFHDDTAGEILDSKNALKNIMFSRALSGCGDMQPSQISI
jgi:hypothetical protein